MQSGPAGTDEVPGRCRFASKKRLVEEEMFRLRHCTISFSEAEEDILFQCTHARATVALSSRCKRSLSYSSESYYAPFQDTEK
jgi:hypothetical protein